MTDLREALVEFRSELLGRAICLIRRRADAEDLVQETFIRALTFEGGYEDRGQVRAWLHRILHNLFLDHLRHRRLEGRAIDEIAHYEPAQVPEMANLSPGVASALAELPEYFRAPVVLIDLGEASYLEAAAALGIPKGTVMSRLHRGRRALAARLQEEPLG